MPYDLSKFLVIGISSRALFDLSHEHQIFAKEGLEAYRKYQKDHEENILKPGAAFPLSKSILQLNKLIKGKRKAEVIIMSRNSAETSLRIFNSIAHYGLDITRAALVSGASLVPYLEPFKVDLFLSLDADDVRAGIQAGIASALVYDIPQNLNKELDEIRIAFDGDAVIFSDEAEKIYQEKGIEAFMEHEKRNARKPLPEGPFAKLLKTLAMIQSGLGEKAPIRTALVTARNSPSHERVIRTLGAWNVRIDEAFFLGGIPKDKILKAFRPHIYFDDQDVHCKPASKVVPTAKVPYSNTSK